MGLRKGVSGQPPWVPTKKILEQAEQCASLGMSYEQIANALDIAQTTLIAKRHAFPELDKAIERGRAKGVQMVANALFENAVVKKDVKAQTFYLKTKGGFVEEVKKNITINHEDKLREILGDKTIDQVINEESDSDLTEK